MKRCPHCNFIFPDSDEFCDFDKTPLVEIGENEIETKAAPSTLEVRRENRKALLMAAVVGVSLGLILFVVYRATHRQVSSANDQAQQKTIPHLAVAVAPTPTEPLPTPIPTPSVQTPSNVARPSPSPAQSAAHAKLSAGPVATSTESKGSAGSSGKPVIIRLTSGGKVEADEVWRTKEGVWYRRDGVVTLLKSNRVKTIVNQ